MSDHLMKCNQTTTFYVRYFTQGEIYLLNQNTIKEWKAINAIHNPSKKHPIIDERVLLFVSTGQHHQNVIFYWFSNMGSQVGPHNNSLSLLCIFEWRCSEDRGEVGICRAFLNEKVSQLQMTQQNWADSECELGIFQQTRCFVWKNLITNLMILISDSRFI